MYEKDGIMYAGKPAPAPTVVWAEYRGNHTIRAAFATGEVVDVDFSKITLGPAMLPLMDDEILKRFDYSLGFLQWLDGDIDIAPEAMLASGVLVQPAEYAYL